ncbi:pancreatic lipase-related protein [Plakobranchus ocellatus]|uniref:Pancreatic lipase-related protein n=1 Tax=Plakobranchus ocellatus TaxID=259542 RepID=A0AAV4DBN1_9GAST|nr:pancreatic lipase-related protein [Plakobranchus ocellatus]
MLCIMSTAIEMAKGFGIRHSIGDVDFYPNGGKHQPGCPPETMGILTMLKLEDAFYYGACSHSRCLDLFRNSIRKCRYDPQGPCTMGFHTDPSCRGEFYPNTTAVDPFC